eukprot:scaffold24240_cov129-Isochrysis_galbana.AAC.5
MMSVPYRSLTPPKGSSLACFSAKLSGLGLAMPERRMLNSSDQARMYALDRGRTKSVSWPVICDVTTSDVRRVESSSIQYGLEPYCRRMSASDIPDGREIKRPVAAAPGSASRVRERREERRERPPRCARGRGRGGAADAAAARSPLGRRTGCTWNEGDGLGLDEGSIHERGIPAAGAGPGRALMGLG